MKLRFMLTTLLLIVSLSCSNDENNNNNSDVHPIIGEWELTKMTIWQSEFVFDSGEVIYKFYTDGNLDIFSSRPEIESATFTYETINDCIWSVDCQNGSLPVDLLIIEEGNITNRNIFRLTNNDLELYFGQGYLDGYDYYLERIQ
ncbi:MAG: hypothetical protein Tsb0033_11370 [Winogradskyella sp.]